MALYLWGAGSFWLAQEERISNLSISQGVFAKL